MNRLPADLATRIATAQPALWRNTGRRSLASLAAHLADCPAAIDEAETRLRRFAPLLARLFPELAASAGVIESPLIPLPGFAERLGAGPARVLLKADHTLPVSGSVKARGGIHAVLAVAERIATEEGLLDTGEDRMVLDSERARVIFAGRTISVGSTGNLGMSIGIAGRALGFRVVVHMSADAKAWKRDRLRRLGAVVVEHAGDYLAACATARDEAAQDPLTSFIDDENSPDLLFGYAVAGRRLGAQLAALGIVVDSGRPLVLHLPCGVGGAPGGVALGTRLALGDGALAITAEPVQAPCLLLGLASGCHDGIAAADLGLHGRTLADGLAVPRVSGLVSRLVEPLLDGCATVTDEELCAHVATLHRHHGLRLEPSATAGAGSLRLLLTSADGAAMRATLRQTCAIDEAVHILWATGGSLIPDEEFAAILARAG
jgi:D-serine dehydratase